MATLFTSKNSARRVRDRRRGVALVMVLAALFLLTLVVFTLAQHVGEDSFLQRRDSRALDARALAFTGLQIALHPLAGVRTPAMRRQLDAAHGYQARLTGEAGKLNLNWLLNGEDPQKLALLKLYLENRGVGLQERDALVDCLLDWIEPADGPHHLNGSKTAADGQPVPGRPFQDLAEVGRVLGGRALTDLPDWESDFTLLTNGPIDLQWASEAVVAALPTVGETRARGFVKQRRGPDGVDGTEDDLILAKLPDPQAIPQLLGMNPQIYGTVQGFLAVADSTVRVVSVGQAADVRRTLEVVARKGGVQPQILSWKEY